MLLSKYIIGTPKTVILLEEALYVLLIQFHVRLRQFYVLVRQLIKTEKAKKMLYLGKVGLPNFYHDISVRENLTASNMRLIWEEKRGATGVYLSDIFFRGKGDHIEMWRTLGELIEKSKYFEVFFTKLK